MHARPHTCTHTHTPTHTHLSHMTEHTKGHARISKRTKYTSAICSFVPYLCYIFSSLKWLLLPLNTSKVNSNLRNNIFTSYLTAFLFCAAQNMDLEDFFRSTHGKFTHPEVKHWDQQLREARSKFKQQQQHTHAPFAATHHSSAPHTHPLSSSSNSHRGGVASDQHSHTSSHSACGSASNVLITDPIAAEVDADNCVIFKMLFRRCPGFTVMPHAHLHTAHNKYIWPRCNTCTLCIITTEFLKLTYKSFLNYSNDPSHS